MKAQSAYQDVISANLARLNVPGNKQVLTAFEIPEESELQKGGSGLGTIRQLGVKAAPLQSRSVVDFTPGLLDQTNNPTDFAIEGKGFFKVREANGDISYTRNGQFHLDQKGTLITSDGAQVLLQDNNPLTLSPKDNNQIAIAKDGKILGGSAQTPRGSLAFVHATEDPRTVFVQAPNGRFKLADGIKETENTLVPADLEGRGGKVTKSPIATGLASSDVLRQGYLEQSNSDSISQMVNLVQVVRSYEANQKMTIAEDSSTGKMIAAASDT